MKAQLTLEFIGAAAWDRVRAFERAAEFAAPGIGAALIGKFEAGPSVHEITKGHATPIHGNRDYARANSRGSRGVMLRYILESNRLYFVRAPYSWRGVDEYYCAVTETGGIYRLNAGEVEEWLSVL